MQHMYSVLLSEEITDFLSKTILLVILLLILLLKRQHTLILSSKMSSKMTSKTVFDKKSVISSLSRTEYMCYIAQ